MVAGLNFGQPRSSGYCYINVRHNGIVVADEEGYIVRSYTQVYPYFSLENLVRGSCYTVTINPSMTNGQIDVFAPKSGYAGYAIAAKWSGNVSVSFNAS